MSILSDLLAGVKKIEGNVTQAEGYVSGVQSFLKPPAAPAAPSPSGTPAPAPVAAAPAQSPLIKYALMAAAAGAAYFYFAKPKRRGRR